MAISATHYELLKRLNHLLPHGGSLLEIGEANWYGDIEPASIGIERDESPFVIAKRFYQQLFAPSRIVSVDMHGTPAAWKCDLNKPLPPLGTFDVVMNHGTAEHIFHIAQVFASIHDACKVGGTMFHESPFTGWLDHGFYCLQPTLFYDLAAANGYAMAGVFVEEIKSRLIIEVTSREHMTQLLEGGLPNNCMLFVAMVKQTAESFKIPMQGYYAQTLSEEGVKAWEGLR